MGNHSASVNNGPALTGKKSSMSQVKKVAGGNPNTAKGQNSARVHGSK